LKLTNPRSTGKIKAMADVRPIAIDDADSIIRTFHLNLTSDEEHPLLPNLTAEEQAKFEQAQRDLKNVKEKRSFEAEEDSDAPVAKKTRAEITA
jgi:homocitrate synthase